MRMWPKCMEPKACRGNIEGLENLFEGGKYMGVNDKGVRGRMEANKGAEGGRRLEAKRALRALTGQR